MFDLFIAFFCGGVGLGAGATIICAVIMSMTSSKANKRRSFIERTAPRLFSRGPVEMTDGTVFFPVASQEARAAVAEAEALWDEIEKEAARA